MFNKKKGEKTMTKRPISGFKVQVFLGDKEIEHSHLRHLTISNIAVNRIVNSVVDRVSAES